jgi:hypothetical protein
MLNLRPPDPLARAWHELAGCLLPLNLARVRAAAGNPEPPDRLAAIRAAAAEATLAVEAARAAAKEAHQ